MIAVCIWAPNLFVLSTHQGQRTAPSSLSLWVFWGTTHSFSLPSVLLLTPSESSMLDNYLQSNFQMLHSFRACPYLPMPSHPPSFPLEPTNFHKLKISSIHCNPYICLCYHVFSQLRTPYLQLPQHHHSTS